MRQPNQGVRARGEEGTGSAETFLPLVYGELQKLAEARLAGEHDRSILQATALVHEAWLRVSGPAQPVWRNQAHFFSAAARAMNRVLIDHARREHALKRGANAVRVELHGFDLVGEGGNDSLLAVKEALAQLATVNPQCAELVELRFFVGLDYHEAAEALGISARSAKRVWSLGRTWLRRELAHTPGDNKQSQIAGTLSRRFAH